MDRCGRVTGVLSGRQWTGVGLRLCLEGGVMSLRKLGLGITDLTASGVGWQAEAAEGHEEVPRTEDQNLSLGPGSLRWGACI